MNWVATMMLVRLPGRTPASEHWENCTWILEATWNGPRNTPIMWLSNVRRLPNLTDANVLVSSSTVNAGALMEVVKLSPSTVNLTIATDFRGKVGQTMSSHRDADQVSTPWRVVNSLKRAFATIVINKLNRNRYRPRVISNLDVKK